MDKLIEKLKSTVESQSTVVILIVMPSFVCLNIFHSGLSNKVMIH